MSLQQQQQAEENNENCTGTSNWTLNASANSSRASTVCCGGNDGDELLLLKEMKLKMDTLEAKNQMLEGKLENLELKAQNRALIEEAAQKANYQALETKFAKMHEQQQKEMTQLEAKTRELEEKLSSHQTTENGTLNRKMEQLKDEFSKMLSDKIVALRKEMDENGERTFEDNEMKLDHIWGQLMIKGKKLANPTGNIWSGSKTNVDISEFGLNAKNKAGAQYVIAAEGYPISGDQCRKDNFPFPGTIVFYYEVTVKSSNWLELVGFSDGNGSTNLYAIKRNYSHNSYDNNFYYDELWLSGRQHKFEHPAIASSKSSGGVVGCGLLLNSKNRWAVFFTVNGFLLGKQAPIRPMVDRLYPTVYIVHNFTSVEANFGDNLGVKPFKFDIHNCPGLVFE